MSTTIERMSPILRRARAALEAANHEEVFRKNADFPVATSLEEFDVGVPVSERFPSVEALFAALSEDDPTVLVFALQLLFAVDEAAASALAADALRSSDSKGDTPLDIRARRSAARVLANRLNDIPLESLVGWMLAGRLEVPRTLASHPELASPEAQFGLILRLENEPYEYGARARELRWAVLQHLVLSQDRAALDWLFSKWEDEAHPFSNEAAQALLNSGDKASVMRMAARSDDAFSGSALSDTRRFHLVRAIVEAGDVERVLTLVAPRFLGADATRDAASVKAAQDVLTQLTQGLRAQKLPKNDVRLATAILPLLDVGPLKGLAKAFLSLMDQSVVKGAQAPAAPPGKAGKATKDGRAPAAVVPARGRSDHLARYDAGEHRAVWDDLRALGAAVLQPGTLSEARAVAEATMRRFGQNVEAIVAVLRKAKYPFASKKPLPAAKADAAKKLAAIAELAGPLPIAIEVFYSMFDGVDLGQSTEATVPDTKVLSAGALDELGRYDPLIVAPLAAVLADVKALAKRNKGLAESLREPLHPYLGPDPRCKGMGDEVADENPTRLAPSEGIDGLLSGAGEGTAFVDWLRGYVEAGGFRALRSAKDRAVLCKDLVSF
jgi:hypothetical protein